QVMVPLVLLASLVVTIDLRSIDAALSARVVRGIEAETAAVWRPYGVDIRWVGGRDRPAVVDVELTAFVERSALPPPASARLGAPFHRPAGLMRARFSADELGAPDRRPFLLTNVDVARLRSRPNSEPRASNPETRTPNTDRISARGPS